MPKYGLCHICGVYSKLSFEHVPPRAAYNDQRVFEADIQAMVDGKWDGQQRPLQGKWVQRGAGNRTPQRTPQGKLTQPRAANTNPTPSQPHKKKNYESRLV
jgi:hypothetical protein